MKYILQFLGMRMRQIMGMEMKVKRKMRMDEGEIKDSDKN